MGGVKKRSAELSLKMKVKVYIGLPFLYHNRLYSEFLWIFITIILAALTFNFLKNTFLTLFITLESKYSKLQFGINISSIEVRKQKLCISMCHCLQQNLQREIHPGATPFSRVKGFRVSSIKQ